MRLITAPQKLNNLKQPVIFLAGSIEMDTAVEWQDYVIEKLSDLPVTILNPRRDHWNSSWKETIENKKFKEQVAWELKALSRSDYIFLYFDPKSKSPISLLELGLFAASHKIFCCCPKKFWRRGNVEFVCEHFKIPLFADLDKAIAIFLKAINRPLDKAGKQRNKRFFAK